MNLSCRSGLQRSIALNPDQAKTWIGLSSALLGLEQTGSKAQQASKVLDQALDQVKQRTDRLTSLRQRMQIFVDGGYTAIEQVPIIAQLLSELGRYWEAEAWTATGIAMNANSKGLTELRSQIVKKLSVQTPWQVEDANAHLS